MIAAISMMRRRADIGRDQFRRRWLDPHGVMTAQLPGVRYYIQSHCLDAPGTNALARELDIDGFPELWFDNLEARRIAYTSPRIAECNIDSEQFVGAVSRLVTEPQIILERPTVDTVKVVLVAIGPPDPGWSDRFYARVMPMEGGRRLCPAHTARTGGSACKQGPGTQSAGGRNCGGDVRERGRTSATRSRACRLEPRRGTHRDLSRPRLQAGLSGCHARTSS
jgi:uncharacterized protein (TIGR02118 family)